MPVQHMIDHLLGQRLAAQLFVFIARGQGVDPAHKISLAFDSAQPHRFPDP